MKFKEGELYIVYAKDHCTGEPHEISIRTVGWYVKSTKLMHVFTSWEVITDDEELKKGNYEYSNILKSQITKRIKL